MPETYTVLNPDAKSRFVLSAEHAGNAWPADMPPPPLYDGWQDDQFCYDPGAGDFTAKLATALNCPAIYGHYARVLIDLNRLPGNPDLIPKVVDGLPMPMNDIDIPEYERRLTTYYQPYHRELKKLMDNAGPNPVHIAVHSYTRQRRTDAQERPWHLGLLYVHESPVVKHVLASVESIPGKVIGRNEPYNTRSSASGATALHASAYGREAFTLEFRIDQLEDPAQCDAWVKHITQALMSYS
ncbi:MAG: N-formylglutamate amidohydrolase [Bdellovibrionales bacterium]